MASIASRVDGAQPYAWSRWLHYTSWAAVTVVLLWTAFMYSVNWMDAFRDWEDTWFYKVLQEFEMKFGERTFTEAELTAMAVAEAPAGADVAPVPASIQDEAPAYKNRAYGYTVLDVGLVTLPPVFVIGLFALLLSFFKTLASTAPKAYATAHRVRMFFNTPLPPQRFWKRWINGCTITEAFLYIWIVAIELVWFVGYAKTSQKEWDDGEVTEVHALPEGEFNKAQFNLRLAGIGFGILFIAVGPLLFLPAARGSLVNTFLGVHYGTAIKWHRWIGVQVLFFLILHGILYHCLWASHSTKMYREEAFRFEYKHWFSNGAGLVAWCAAVVVSITAIPAFRRNFYWLFYRAHIIGALVFVVFGIVHWNGTLDVLLVGLVVYGIDVAYRWFQTRHSVTLRLSQSSGGRIISIAIPLQEGVQYHDGSHVWICFPDLGAIEYHPFSIASTAADPQWCNRMLVLSKVYDRWTEDVARKVDDVGDGSATITAKVQGPFEGHDMTASEERIYTHMVFFAGGIGATAVMPMIKRAALRRAGKAPGDVEGPPIVVVYTCRNECELAAIAPVLAHADHVSVCVFYTGKAPLQSCTLDAGHGTVPAALLSGLEGGSSSSGGSASAGQGRGLPRMITSRALAATVWVLSFFVAFWSVILIQFYTSRPPQMQLGLVNEHNEQKRYRNAAILTLVPALVICPLFPLAVIWLWNVIKPRRPAKRSQIDGLDETGSGTMEKGKGQQQSAEDMGLEQVVITYSDGKASAQSTAPGGRSVQIHSGRPDVAAQLADLPPGYADGTFLGVWTAGPKMFNMAVYTEANKSGKRADVTQMAFEL